MLTENLITVSAASGDADSLLPMLKLLALPWSFVENAQPSLDLSQRSRDIRISDIAVFAADQQPAPREHRQQQPAH